MIAFGSDDHFNSEQSLFRNTEWDFGETIRQYFSFAAVENAVQNRIL